MGRNHIFREMFLIIQIIQEGNVRPVSIQTCPPHCFQIGSFLSDKEQMKKIRGECLFQSTNLQNGGVEFFVYLGNQSILHILLKFPSKASPTVVQVVCCLKASCLRVPIHILAYRFVILQWLPFSNFTNFYGLEMPLLPFHPENEKNYFSSGSKFSFTVSKVRVVNSSGFS